MRRGSGPFAFQGGDAGGLGQWARGSTQDAKRKNLAEGLKGYVGPVEATEREELRVLDTTELHGGKELGQLLPTHSLVEQLDLPLVVGHSSVQRHWQAHGIVLGIVQDEPIKGEVGEVGGVSVIDEQLDMRATTYWLATLNLLAGDQTEAVIGEGVLPGSIGFMQGAAVGHVGIGDQEGTVGVVVA